jgi:hypothetical protein
MEHWFPLSKTSASNWLDDFCDLVQATRLYTAQETLSLVIRF